METPPNQFLIQPRTQIQ